MSLEKDLPELLEIARQFLMLVSGELDPYTSEKGEIKVGVTTVSLFTVDHIQFAKYGRGAGKKPPFQDILDYVKKNNISFDGTDQNGTAWAIVNSIAKNGTSNFVRNAPNAMDEAIEKHYEQFTKDLSEKFKLIILDDINAIYNKLPVERIFRM